MKTNDIEAHPDKKITFTDCVMAAAGEPEFVKEFNRLTGCNLGQSQKRDGITLAIDNACGYSGESKDDMGKFCAFVYEFVWSTLPRKEVG